MTRLLKAFGLLALSLFLFQCQKDVSYIGGPDTITPITPDPIMANLQGNIVDENNQPAAGVSIIVGNNTALTNATGYFRINDAALDKNTSLVTAEKAGYFKGYRVFSATTGTNQIVIKLVKKNIAGTITAASGGTATLTNGAKISLPANSVVMASTSNAYTGDVKVYASYINPGATDISQTVPGSFMATDKDGKRVTLSSFGMLAVELESAAGEKLQVKTGAVATITCPIPAAELTAAPATIPLWYVDEQTGVWKEEGTATKQGNSYVGEVKHFTYWNCDYPYEAVTLTFTLKNADGLPLVNVPVKVTPAGVWGAAHGYTDSLGQVRGLVPANKDLVLEITDPCGNAAYTQHLLPLTKNTNLGVINVSFTTPSLVAFKGTLLNCSGQPVKNGTAIISFNNIIRYAATNDNGEFATSFLTCAGFTTATVIGVDQTSQQQGATNTVNIVAPLTNAGNITACGTSSVQFINYTVDGTDYIINSTANDSIIGFSINQGTTNNVNITGSQKLTPANYLKFVVRNATAAGTFPMGEMGLNHYRTIVLKPAFNVTFTTFANAAGEFYEGTLSGQFTADSTTTVHTISSTFKVRRNN